MAQADPFWSAAKEVQPLCQREMPNFIDFSDRAEQHAEKLAGSHAAAWAISTAP